jgi:hypothetical protein
MNDFTKEEIKRINHLNERLLLVMGVATSVIMELGKYVPVEKKDGIYWVIEAIENLVYLDKPLPPFPER